jgi:hypothetical protein
MLTAQRFRPFLALLGAIALVLGLGACGSSFPPPTEPEIKEAVQTFFTEVYGKNNGGAEFKDISFEFGSADVGNMMSSPMERNGEPVDFYPVRIPVVITVTYSNNPTVEVTRRGERTDDVFFFYKDGFDKWTFRTGRL